MLYDGRYDEPEQDGNAAEIELYASKNLLFDYFNKFINIIIHKINLTFLLCTKSGLL